MPRVRELRRRVFTGLKLPNNFFDLLHAVIHISYLFSALWGIPLRKKKRPRAYGTRAVAV
jgi:hypothetical protein